MRKVDDPAAKASIIWVLGEFGSTVPETPYLLETCIESYEEESSTEIKLHLLTAALKLFFRRPPEVTPPVACAAARRPPPSCLYLSADLQMQKMLGSLLKRAINDASNQDVHGKKKERHSSSTTNSSQCHVLLSCHACLS